MDHSVHIISVQERICYKCNGVGVWIKDTPEGPIEYDPCPVCLGHGALQTRCREVLPTDIFESYAVLETFDAAEYNALTDTQKEGVQSIISCGRVDLADGRKSKTRLWNWFGAGSDTVANLEALISG